MSGAFELEGDAVLSLARGLSVAALLSVFGALLFQVNFAPARFTNPAGFVRRWLLLVWGSWSVALLTALVWLFVQTAAMATTQGWFETVGAVPIVLGQSSFGHILLARVLVLLAVAVALWLRAYWPGTVLAGIATALQAWHGHSAAMQDGPSLLLLSGVLHLLAAGAWLGGLVPLLLLVWSATPDLASRVSRRFSPMATGCVIVLAATAGFQFWVLIGGLPGLVGTGYGWVVLAKLGLFSVLLGFAAFNRFRLTPALMSKRAASAQGRLCWSIALETSAGLLVVLAAGFLSNFAPSMHVQPVWPFAEQFSLLTVREDADFRLEVFRALLAVAGAVALLLLAVQVRRLRWPLVAVAALTAWLASPHLSLLFVEAYPTSFYESPTGFTVTTIAAGATLYSGHCAACHGAGGEGDGTTAREAAIPPADLTASHLWMHADGELFWWLSHGIDTPEGGLAMPGFASVLSEDDRWALIDYIRANNAGATLHRSGAWSPPVKAPAFEAKCGNRVVALGALRGQFVRLVFGEGLPVTSGGDVVTVLAGAGARGHLDNACVAPDDRLSLAYGIMSGITVDGLSGAEFLIDGEGWLRAIQQPGGPDPWNDPRALMAIINALKAKPVVARGAEPMTMRM